VPVAWNVRRIRADEGLQLRALRLHALATAPTAFGSTLAREQGFAEALWHQRAADGAAGLERMTVIAERGERWVGMANGLAAEPTELALPGPILVGMFVDDSARRLGIGQALIESIKIWARLRGDKTLQLWVVSCNLAARALYRHCGFAASGATRAVSHTAGLIELQLVAPLTS
jgi:GNAT superfamily N-acetyltransferase